jgi:iron complex transport system substrate-binding protein
VVTFRYGTEELTRGWLEIMAAATGDPARADRFIDWRDATLADIAAATEGLAEGDRPRVLYFLRYLSELRVAGSGTYNDYYIGVAGGTNPAGDTEGWRTVNPEQVIAWDPEVILLNGFEEALSPQDVYDNPLFAGLTAVEERRVYKVPLGGYRWDPPNQESPLMWLWLTELLHPELMDRPLRSEIAEAYDWIYGTRPSEAQIDGILRLAMNGEQAHYGVFAPAPGQ